MDYKYMVVSKESKKSGIAAALLTVNLDDAIEAAELMAFKYDKVSTVYCIEDSRRVVSIGLYD